jgi:uncharacterized protein YbjT (DUF2867 family)
VGIRPERGNAGGRSGRCRVDGGGGARLWTRLLSRPLDGLDGLGLCRSRPENGPAFAQAAERAGISRIIYLGGLGETGAGLSEHLASRREVEAMLASGSVPVTVFRAGMVIGAGSASFEILRYLVERLPVMITPKWVTTESQPIAVGNVLGYLVDCLRCRRPWAGRSTSAGSDIVSYQTLMRIMAEERGLPRRLVIPVPVLTPRLSSLWIHLVTP